MPYKDIEKRRQSNKRYYQKHKKKIAIAAKERKDLVKKKLMSYLKTCECAECKNKDWRVLEFDHLNPLEKTKGISEMVKDRNSWKTIKKEIDKCQVLCANCHRIKTFEQFNYYKRFMDC